MGLSGHENGKIYHSLLQKVCKAAPGCGIDITKTITHNQAIVVIKFITWCQRKWSFFRQFEDGWPVHDMLAFYLVNQSTVAKLKVRKLKAVGVNMRGIESSSEDEASEDEPADEPPSKKVKHNKNDENPMKIKVNINYIDLSPY
ncbi:hypothetical protein PILCRDRAFT_12503 [Piloderma croceum F 1598]|uniref:Uncharacterized protein n=1 Tax=Piloderma croceum (strain F 1598) TaxID=765440 RepID=A0A0C3AS98_PILCF|nr:hypothetical protein PILCRDRAFT_12503 [Piloderma croceum F 1598]